MNQVKICNKSKELIKRAFSGYKQEKNIPVDFILTGETTFHLYPVADTKNDKNEDLLGYDDALLFNVDIYNEDKRIKYSTIQERDAISFDKVDYVTVKIFKDMSTMITIHGDFKISLFQCLSIRPAKKQ